MSGLKRFFALGQENSIFKFTIDTRNIVAGANNGSENPLTFRIPTRQWITNNCIIRVSDGRPDVSITSSTSPNSSLFTLNFSTAGVYQITIIGKLIFNTAPATNPAGTPYGFDKLKLIEINNWGYAIEHGASAFDACTNLLVKAENTLLLPVNSSDFFRSIKGFENPLDLINTSRVTNALRILSGIQQPLVGTLNPFWLSIITMESTYAGLTFLPTVNKIEIISPTLEILLRTFDNIIFQNTGTIELICATPNLKTMFNVLRNGQVKTRCHLGKVDVRNVNNPSGFISSSITTAQVDATLLGWANLPFMQSGITWNWMNSKYSNNPAVLAALNKITNEWGVIFTNLTMA